MEEYFTAYSCSLINKNLTSDKIILHSDVFAKTYNLSNKNEVIIWELINLNNSKITHCTVLEYSSYNYDTAYLPNHIMENLEIPEGGKIKLSLITEPIIKAEKVLLQPFQSTFFKLNSYKEILENSLKNYCVITEGDIIDIDTQYNIEKLIVKAINPSGYVGIILNTNLEVEFDNALIENKEFLEKKTNTSHHFFETITDDKKDYKLEEKEEEKQEIFNNDKEEYKDEKYDVNNSDHKKCINCNGSILQKNFYLHEIHCIKNIKFCNICKTGISKKEFSDHLHCVLCKMVISFKSSSEHYEMFHKKVNCIYCNEEFTNTEIDSHIQKCEYSPAKCLYCKLDMPFINLNTHENICGSKTIQCEVCNKFILQRKLASHNLEEHNIKQNK
jgi:hypothetical protein